MARINKIQLDMLTAGRSVSNKCYRKNKYHAQKVIVDGFMFDSGKEANRYQELKLQQHAGLITGLQLKPEFVLQEKFKHDGKIERAIKYEADFKYEKGDKIVIEDVKGFKTQVYRLKRKMFLFRYPELVFIET